ncbi:MAG: hypothetical protein ABFC34_09295, partial [Methanobacterium sp.]
CDFTGNTAQNGGAIYNYGTCTVENSSFAQNTGTQGGAITNYGQLALVNSIFNSNQAIEMGGALYNSPQGDVTINSTTFTENSATDAESYGGAISSYGLLTVTGTILTSNLATYGSSVANTGKISALATGNWWGSADGPEESAIYGDVNIDNWLTSNPSVLNNLNPENSEPLLVMMGVIVGTNTDIDTETTTTAGTDSETPTTSNNDSASIETNNSPVTTTNTEQNSSTDSDPLTTSFPLASITWGCLMIVGGVIIPRRK